ncbi:hypothetical protein PAL_GLEAN10014532 [Pteropus alecto]|uniref:Uncharacterized protein n=1 Tax=Pteropus alecto TaxID=9402 RepID=L5KLP7_PTEAL|nr:hypothetical protein PAL_GLEAN10014532 [Pteropus alecto]
MEFSPEMQEEDGEERAAVSSGTGRTPVRNISDANETPEVRPLSPTGTVADCQPPQGRLTLAHMGWRTTASTPASGQRWRPPTLTTELHRWVLPCSPLHAPESTACCGVPRQPLHAEDPDGGLQTPHSTPRTGP